MSGWLKRRRAGGEPAGPPRTIRSFGFDEELLTRSGVSRDGDAWRIEAREGGSVALFELHDPGVEECLLSYRASVKTADARGVYLEMWCRLPGKGEFFSKGLRQVLKGTRNWSSQEVPFVLKKGQRPDLVKLNVAFKGSGTAWVKGIELLETPLH